MSPEILHFLARKSGIVWSPPALVAAVGGQFFSPVTRPPWRGSIGAMHPDARRARHSQHHNEASSSGIRIDSGGQDIVRATVAFARLQDQRVSLCLLLALPGLTSGCAFTENRLRDAEDIFTLAGGFGLGSCVHAGPISTGIGMIWDVYGLSSGHFGENQMAHFDSGITLQLIGIGGEASWFNPEVRDRGKKFDAYCYLIGLPEYEAGLKGKSLLPPYFFQFEVSVGLFGGLRVGFNLAELVDFVLGFAGIDLLRDDVAGLQQDESYPDEAAAFPPGQK